MTEEERLDKRLIHAMSVGEAALPEDLGQLTDYLNMIGELLGEKSTELEATLAQVDANAAEIATLQELGLTVAQKAASVRAESIVAILYKFRILRSIGDGTDQAGHASATEERLAASIEADLASLAGIDRT